MKYILAVMLAVSLVSSSKASEKSSWLIGFWTKTADEDGDPSDVMEFRSDGSNINYGFYCGIASKQIYHEFAGDIYVTAEVRDKGPIAIIFRPSQDKSKLTFTSPRTRKNAVYERLPSNPCATHR